MKNKQSDNKQNRSSKQDLSKNKSVSKTKDDKFSRDRDVQSSDSDRQAAQK